MLSNVFRLGETRPTYRAAMADKPTDPVRVGLGMRLKSAREAKNYTQQMIAERFSVNKATVSAWETGRGIPDALTLRELAKVYDVSADSLLWEDSLSPEAMKFAADFDHLTDKQRRTFRTVWTAFVVDSFSDEEVELKMPLTKTEKEDKKGS